MLPVAAKLAAHVAWSMLAVLASLLALLLMVPKVEGMSESLAHEVSYCVS